MKVIKERHTSEYLKKIILDVLKEYEIKIEQIYTITTDNAANMIKLIKLLILHDEEDDEDDDLNDYLINDDLNNNDIDNDDLNNNDIIHDENKELFNIENINLAPNARSILIDCCTRWNSIYLMLERLLELKSFCQEISLQSDREKCLSENEWKIISDILKALYPAYVLTKYLQSEQLTMGDFYAAWIKCLMQTSKNIEILNTMPTCSYSKDNLDDDFEDLLKSHESLNKNNSQGIENYNKCIEIEYIIRSFDNIERLEKDTNLLNYWENVKNIIRSNSLFKPK
ncbi:unnamed protein product [Gordionus sp. m RMFG-2023]